MKNILLVGATLFILFVSPSEGMAQQNLLGLKGGISIPNLTGGSSADPINTGYSSRLAGDFGLSLTHQISHRLALSLGAQYSSQGGLKDKFQPFYLRAT